MVNLTSADVLTTQVGLAMLAIEQVWSVAGAHRQWLETAEDALPGHGDGAAWAGGGREELVPCAPGPVPTTALSTHLRLFTRCVCQCPSPGKKVRERGTW